MSNKNRTRKTRTTSTTGSSRNLRSVPDQGTAVKGRTDTEDKLWTALHANPNSTAADLASTAKIGKSTAAKILVKWAKDGSVTRTPGIAEGGRRAADLWAVTDTDVGTEPTTDHTRADDVSAGDADSADNAQPDTHPDTTAPGTTVADAKLPDAQPADSDPTEATSTEPTDTGPANTEAADTAKAEPGVEATTPTADSTTTDGNTATNGSDGGSSGDGKKARLSPGTLRGMVEDHLRDHPGEEFGPTAIAKALGGKSSGAVSNALDKLVADGTAVKTKESPRRFALAPAEQEAASTATT
jgi:hypothetical protein